MNENLVDEITDSSDDTEEGAKDFIMKKQKNSDFSGFERDFG